jgi:hypothetical protein
MNAIKVIFLDFDGVLNCSRHLANEDLDAWGTAAHEDSKLNRVAIERLNRIVDATGAFVVVSSMWRINRMRVELQEILGRNGFTGTVLDKTPNLKEPRGLEVKAWLYNTRRDVKAFVILDDKDDFKHFGRNHLVQTSFDGGGLLDEHIEPAVKILGRPWRKP